MKGSQKELAELLGLTSRQVHNLVEQGMPREAKSGKAAYDLGACVQWYVAFKAREAEKRARPEEGDPLKRRELEAKVRRLELELAEMEGTIIPLGVHEQRLGDVCDRLRGVCLNVPGGYVVRVQAATTAADAQRVLRELRDQLLEALAGTAADVDDEGPETDADGDRAAA